MLYVCVYRVNTLYEHLRNHSNITTLMRFKLEMTYTFCTSWNWNVQTPLIICQHNNISIKTLLYNFKFIQYVRRAEVRR